MFSNKLLWEFHCLLKLNGVMYTNFLTVTSHSKAYMAITAKMIE